MTYYRKLKQGETAHLGSDEFIPGMWMRPVKMDIDEIVRELAGCVLHESWDTGCDFDYAEARAIILRIGGDHER